MGVWHELIDSLVVTSPLATAIDVVLVYYIIYRVLLAIRGTRAASMVIGLVLIGGAFYVADRLELTTISWLLDNVISYLLILVIVVFQADIRRALGQLGQGIMPAAKQRATPAMIEEVVTAVAQLARLKLGALIVFEREASISSIVDNATTLDAQIGRQLLVSLFVPARENELHDGAVVIGQNHRLIAARALLPLSADPDLGSEFGTRHRAALGITEESDCVVVVVSEERGEISLCFAGSIARDLDMATLRRALFGLLAGDSPMALQVAAAADVGRAVASLGRREVAK